MTKPVRSRRSDGEAPTARLRAFRAADLDQARALWERVDGVSVTEADAEASFALFLKRNRGLSLVAVQGETLVGTILVGHDGRRGYLYHLAVTPELRLSGLGRRLVSAALERLARVGIRKCHLMAFTGNEDGRAFWERTGAELRDDLVVFSLPT